ncbi:MAG: DUF4404 family protein [Lentisphaeria bacterium]
MINLIINKMKENAVDRKEVDREIEQLRHELSNYCPELNDRFDQIVEALESDSKSEGDIRSMMSRAIELEEEALRRTEVEHPEVSQLLNRIADLLSSLGI